MTRSRRGVSLIELLVSVLMTLVLGGALFSIFKKAGSLALRLGQDVKLSQESLDDDGPTVWII